eukprot:gene11572-15495_t
MSNGFSISSTYFQKYEEITRFDSWLFLLNSSETFPNNFNESNDSSSSSEIISLKNIVSKTTTKQNISSLNVRIDERLVRKIKRDVLRTRTDDAFFASARVQYVLNRMLLEFCMTQKIDYIQGINEILAPILAIPNSVDDEPYKYISIGSNNTEIYDENDENQLLANSREYHKHFENKYLLFERFITTLSPTVFFTKGVIALQIQFITFHLILAYQEPLFSTFLRTIEMKPDLYTMSWFVTLFSRRLPIHLVWHVWDLLVQMKHKPYFIVFLAVSLLQSRKDMILHTVEDKIPEAITSLTFDSDFDIASSFNNALALEDSMPKSYIKVINLLGFNCNVADYVRDNGQRFLLTLPCVTINCNEIAEKVTNSFLQDDLSTKSIQKNQPNPMILLDCRKLNAKNTHYGINSTVIIEGSIIISKKIQDEICRFAAYNQYKTKLDHIQQNDNNYLRPENILLYNNKMKFSKMNESNFGLTLLSHEAESLLAFLWDAFVFDHINNNNNNNNSDMKIVNNQPLQFAIIHDETEDNDSYISDNSSEIDNLYNNINSRNADLSNNNKRTLSMESILNSKFILPLSSPDHYVENDCEMRNEKSNSELLSILQTDISCVNRMSSFFYDPSSSIEENISNFGVFLELTNIYGVYNIELLINLLLEKITCNCNELNNYEDNSQSEVMYSHGKAFNSLNQDKVIFILGMNGYHLLRTIIDGRLSVQDMTRQSPLYSSDEENENDERAIIYDHNNSSIDFEKNNYGLQIDQTVHNLIINEEYFASSS